MHGPLNVRYLLFNRSFRCAPSSVLATENTRNLDCYCCYYVVWGRQKFNSAFFLVLDQVGDASISHVAAQS